MKNRFFQQSREQVASWLNELTSSDLEQKFEIPEFDGVPRSALLLEAVHTAASKGLGGLVQQLMALPDMPPSGAEKALRAAVRLGHLDLIIDLLQHNISVACMEAVVRSAAQAGHTEILVMLLHMEPVVSQACRNMALAVATQYGHEDMVKRLVEIPGMDPSDHDSLAFRSAAAAGRLSLLHFFLQVSPSVNPSAKNDMALFSASRQGHVDIVRYLMTLNGVRPSIKILIAAVHANHLDVVRCLIEHEHIRQHTSTHYALIEAMKMKNFEMMQLLLTLPGILKVGHYLVGLAAASLGHIETFTLLRPHLTERMMMRTATDIALAECLPLLHYVLEREPQLQWDQILKSIARLGKTKSVSLLLDHHSFTAAAYLDAIHAACQSQNLPIIHNLIDKCQHLVTLDDILWDTYSRTLINRYTISSRFNYLFLWNHPRLNADGLLARAQNEIPSPDLDLFIATLRRASILSAARHMQRVSRAGQDEDMPMFFVHLLLRSLIRADWVQQAPRFRHLLNQLRSASRT